MRKSIVTPNVIPAVQIGDLWRDLERIARVEMTSEDPAHPIEQAIGKVTTGWRASSVGPQVIRLHFDEPLSIKRIQIHFVDHTAERSQEFALLAKGEDGTMHEVARQQWNFSPGGATEEIEDYVVALSGVTALELQIDPDRSNHPSQSQNYASLMSLKIA